MSLGRQAANVPAHYVTTSTAVFLIGVSLFTECNKLALRSSAALEIVGSLYLANPEKFVNIVTGAVDFCVNQSCRLFSGKKNPATTSVLPTVAPSVTKRNA